ncbi:putative phosphate acyltransferase [Micromonospora lupini str. Lupac 08]|uniref:phosphate acyltransferase n=1 Tax=Micromonospora lupini str. Lupac 08 TaxID=1150864 RepID=I0L478_9ACTN|nr:putative phosphate acyltransferase [Micromonospora lupini str. Lupac 08]
MGRQGEPPDRRLRVAVDVAGADLGPEPVVAGALAAAATVDIALVGPQALIRPLLPGGVAPAGVRLVHASDVVGMGEDPVAATYAKRRSSLLVAAGEVAAGRADAMVTPGNTGAAVLAAAVRLGRVPGVSNPRPWPRCCRCRAPARPCCWTSARRRRPYRSGLSSSRCWARSTRAGGWGCSDRGSACCPTGTRRSRAGRYAVTRTSCWQRCPVTAVRSRRTTCSEAGSTWP